MSENGLEDLLSKAKTTHELVCCSDDIGTENDPFKLGWIRVKDVVEFFKDKVVESRSKLQELLDAEQVNYDTAKAMVNCPEREELLTHSWGRIKLLKMLLEDSVPLSKLESEDLKVSEKELASGKCKTFETAEDLIADLHKGRKKGSVEA